VLQLRHVARLPSEIVLAGHIDHLDRKAAERLSTERTSKITREPGMVSLQNDGVGRPCAHFRVDESVGRRARAAIVCKAVEVSKDHSSFVRIWQIADASSSDATDAVSDRRPGTDEVEFAESCGFVRVHESSCSFSGRESSFSR
jgi:hypothetical protein